MMTDRLCARALPLTALAVGFGLALTGCGGDEGEPAGQDAGQDEVTEQEGDGAEDGAEGDSDEEADQDLSGDAFARAEIADAVGNEMGQVTFTETEGGVQVRAEIHGLTDDLAEGFRGFHIHENGLCEPQSSGDDGEIGDFLSAGGHLHGEEEDLGVVEGEEEPEDEELDEQAPGGETGADGEAGADHPAHAGDLPNLMVAEDGTARLTVVTDRITPELLTEGDGTAVIIHSGADNHGNVPERYAPAGPDADTLATGDAGERSACGVIEDS